MTQEKFGVIPPAIRQLINRRAHDLANAAETEIRERMFSLVRTARANGADMPTLMAMVSEYPKKGKP